jgi:hypothetical protein
MIFPFEITRHYKLPDAEFGEYSTTEIIDRVYDFLKTEHFKSIEKENNTIEFSGKYKRPNFNIASDLFTQCIDSGFIDIEIIGDTRTLVYRYQTLNFFLYAQLILLVPVFIVGTLMESLRIGLTCAGIIFLVVTAGWILFTSIQPATVSAPLEIMRVESIRKKLGKENQGC